MAEYKAYAGIGSRETPEPTLNLMRRIAISLQNAGWTLRSGHAHGADRAFEMGAGVRAEVYRPRDVTPAALDLASQFHPAWERCDKYARSLHARNGFQVLGMDLATPSRFVCCWTRDGKASGGTGQALRIATAYHIPVFNLHDPKAYSRLTDFLPEVSWL